MPFGGSANPATISIPNPGDFEDVAVTFVDVPPDESITEDFTLGGQNFQQVITLLAASPVSSGFTVPAGVTRTLVSIDDVQAVVRYTRT